jgi:hypothetical protein
MINFNLITYLTENAVGVGFLGAIVGGSTTAAKSISEHKKGKIDRKQVIQATSKEAAGVGVSTAVSAVAAGAIGGGFILSLGTVVVTATAAKYAWDRGLDALARRSQTSPLRPPDTAAEDKKD